MFLCAPHSLRTKSIANQLMRWNAVYHLCTLLGNAICWKRQPHALGQIVALAALFMVPPGFVIGSTKVVFMGESTLQRHRPPISALCSDIENDIARFIDRPRAAAMFMYCTANIIRRAQDVSDIVTGLINLQDAPAPIWLGFIDKRRLLGSWLRSGGSSGL